jgi:tetrahydromethanopterin S-methyltransferase subunit H
MQTKNFCIKIDKTLPDPDYHPQGMKWRNKPNIIDYKHLEWLANADYELESFEGKDYVYIYSENREDLQYYIDYVGDVHEVYLTIESNVKIIESNVNLSRTYSF